MCVYYMHGQCPWRPEKDIRSPRAGLTESCYKLPCGCWKPNLGPLEGASIPNCRAISPIPKANVFKWTQHSPLFNNVKKNLQCPEKQTKNTIVQSLTIMRNIHACLQWKCSLIFILQKEKKKSASAWRVNAWVSEHSHRSRGRGNGIGNLQRRNQERI